MLPDIVIEALRFLALPREAKVRYLPTEPSLMKFAFPRTGNPIEFAAEASLHASLAILHNSGAEISDEMLSLFSEIECVIYMTGAVAHDAVYPTSYMWFLEKNKYSVNGPFDGCWEVIRRLALVALEKANVSASEPTMTFEELVRITGFIKKPSD